MDITIKPGNPGSGKCLLNWDFFKESQSKKIPARTLSPNSATQSNEKPDAVERSTYGRPITLDLTVCRWIRVRVLCHTARSFGVVRFVMSRFGLKCGCEWEFDFVNRGFCPTDKRGMDTEMRNKNFLPISPVSNKRYLIVYYLKMTIHLNI